MLQHGLQGARGCKRTETETETETDRQRDRERDRVYTCSRWPESPGAPALVAFAPSPITAMGSRPLGLTAAALIACAWAIATASWWPSNERKPAALPSAGGSSGKNVSLCAQNHSESRAVASTAAVSAWGEPSL